MPALAFMQNKYSVNELITHYLEDIKALRPLVKTASDETKLQLYYQAANTFKRVSAKEWVQFALSYAKGATGKSAEIRHAFPQVLGNRITHPSEIDTAYLRLLLEYANAFKQYKMNLKDWMLRVVINSRFSPLTGFVEREIDQVIENTTNKLRVYPV